MKNWADYLDEKGMIRHLPGPAPHGDQTVNGGGDAINREGHVAFCYEVGNSMGVYSWAQATSLFPGRAIDLEEVIWLCMDTNAGCFTRYWQAPYNKADDEDFGTSRDQFEPVMIPALIQRLSIANQILTMVEMRNGALPNLNIEKGDLNGDALFPDNWAALYRAKSGSGNEIRIFLGDLYLFIQVLIRVFLSYKKEEREPGVFKRTNVGDSLNLTMRTIWGWYCRSTWPSKLSAWVFGKFVYGGVQYQLDVYFAPKHAPPINECYRPIVSKVFPKPIFFDSVT